MNPKVLELSQRPQYEQRTPEWYTARNTMITASAAANLLVKNEKTCKYYIDEYNLRDTFVLNGKCCNPYSNKTQFIFDKCGQGTFKGNMATYWGQKYEPVVTDIYAKLTNKNVIEFGLIGHSGLSWIGASPDGITEDGIMLEIKCPYRRQITGIPPFMYWIQVQIQLECCDLEFCDFIEYTFMEEITKEEWLDDATLDKKAELRGLFIQNEPTALSSIPCAQEDMSYLYPPKEYINNIDTLLNWANSNVKGGIPYTKKSIIYWKAVNSSIVRIKRNRDFFEAIKSTLEKEWKQVLFYKKNDNWKQLLGKPKESVGNHVLKMDLDDEVICIIGESEEECLL